MEAHRLEPKKMRIAKLDAALSFRKKAIVVSYVWAPETRIQHLNIYIYIFFVIQLMC